MYIIELTDCALAPRGDGNGLRECFLSIAQRDVCAIEVDEQDDALCLLQVLATVIPPISGNYRFQGRLLDFSDYRKLLPCKKKIGYISQDAAMISNRTVRENLLLMRYYYENSLSIHLDAVTARLCHAFELEDKLDLRPGALDPLDLQCAIMIRELTKSPDVLLMDRPEDFIGHAKFDRFNDALKKLLSHDTAIVALSYDKQFVEMFANRKIIIAEGKLTTA